MITWTTANRDLHFGSLRDRRIRIWDDESTQIFQKSHFWDDDFFFETLEGYGDLEIEYESDNVILSLVTLW